MGVRAVITVTDEDGHRRQFWAAWASPHFQIPHLARFIHNADRSNTPLDMTSYIAYTATLPNTLPAQDITDQRWYTDPDATGDLDHRYELQLCQTRRTFRFVVRKRPPHHEPGRWRISHDLTNRADLYGTAARMCAQLAAHARRRLAHNGSTAPGEGSAEDWHHEQDMFAAWLTADDPNLSRTHDAPVDTPPPIYSVDQTRALARQLRHALTRLYPGVNTRPRVRADATITVTVPAHLATGPDLTLITAVVFEVTGTSHVPDVRTHKPSRYGVRIDADGIRSGIYATITLRPATPGAPNEPACTPPPHA
jgi:hypothetical protein